MRSRVLTRLGHAGRVCWPLSVMRPGIPPGRAGEGVVPRCGMPRRRARGRRSPESKEGAAPCHTSTRFSFWRRSSLRCWRWAFHSCRRSRRLTLEGLSERISALAGTVSTLRRNSATKKRGQSAERASRYTGSAARRDPHCDSAAAHGDADTGTSDGQRLQRR